MKIAFIILAHQHPAQVADLARAIVASGHQALVHYDLNGAGYEELEAQVAKVEKVHLVQRIRVDWGEWSMVEATLNALRAIFDHQIEADYVHLMSGADLPIRPIQEFERFLAGKNGLEFIEAVNITHRKWISGGIDQDRYRYRHYFNWQRNKRLFNLSYEFQKALGMKRRFVADFTPHMGSQWWTLTRETCQMILKESSQKALTDFFKTVWIPDEMYIQTLIGTLLPRTKLSGVKLTLNQFDSNGIPLNYYDDHIDYLGAQGFFFARKISPGANRLREHYLEVASQRVTKPRAGELPELGVESADYKVFAAAALRGFHPFMKPGMSPKKPWYGCLEFNRRKYFVIHVPTVAEGREVQDVINKQENFVCHGDLYAVDEIDFVDGIDSYSGFNKSEVVLRDDDPAAFWIQVLHETGKHSGYLQVWDSEHEIYPKCYWDDNAIHIIVKGSHDAYYKDRFPVNDGQPWVNTIASPEHVEAFNIENSQEYASKYEDMCAVMAKENRRHFSVDLNHRAWKAVLQAALNEAVSPAPRGRQPVQSEGIRVV